MAKFCLTNILHIADMAGLGQHILHISAHVNFVMGVFLRIKIKEMIHTFQELKEEISAAVISINKHTVADVVQNLQRLLQLVLDANGVHSETYSLDFHSPKTTVFTNIKHNNIC
jgi:hypothetical protein